MSEELQRQSTELLSYLPLIPDATDIGTRIKELLDAGLPSKEIRAELVERLIKPHPRLGIMFLQREVCRDELDRLPTSKVIACVTELSTAGFHRDVMSLTETLLRRSIEVPRETLFGWAKAACDARAFKPGAMIVLYGKLDQDQILPGHQLAAWAKASAEQKHDHGITRFFTMLLMRLEKKRRKPNEGEVDVIVDIMYSTYTYRHDADRKATVDFLLRAMREYLAPDIVEEILRKFKTKLRGIIQEIQDFEQNLDPT